MQGFKRFKPLLNLIVVNILYSYRLTMKLSSKTEYAILALLELGQRYDKGLVLSREIASSRDIPESFIERILLTLKNGGVIVSVRGANGGHCLARDPGENKCQGDNRVI